MRRNPTRVILGTGFALVLLTALPAGAREGFGLLGKKTATLTRVSPPAVFLTGTKFDVRAHSAGKVDESIVQRLKSQLESGLISRDSRLTAEPGHPETLIEVTLLNENSNERWEKRQEIATRQVGKDAKGKPVFESYPVEVNFKTVTYSFGTSYKVTDATKGASLDAGSVPFNFTNSYREGQGAPEIFSLQNSAIGAVVDHITRRLTPTRESISVLLPKGSLDDLGNLATAGQWNRYLEALEKHAPLSNPSDDSYRQFALGTAYEALGYAADDPETTLKYLEQASVYYGKALESNSGEKFFSQSYDSFWSHRNVPAPLDRVKEAIVSYRRIKDFQSSQESLVASKSLESSKPSAPAKAEPRGIDNSAVIRMVKAGLETDVILSAIDTAPHREFDTSAQGLIQLAEANVDKKIIRRIQEVAGGKKASPKPAPAGKKKPGSGR